MYQKTNVSNVQLHTKYNVSLLQRLIQNQEAINASKELRKEMKGIGSRSDREI